MKKNYTDLLIEEYLHEGDFFGGNEDDSEVNYSQVRGYETKEDFDSGYDGMCEAGDEDFFNSCKEDVDNGTFYAIVLGDFSCKYDEDEVEYDDTFTPIQVYPAGLDINHLTEALVKDTEPTDKLNNELTEAIDKAAAKQFNDALNNKVIDAVMFHKAYDSEIQKEASSNPDFNPDIFITDINDVDYGCLKNRGTYGTILKCNDVHLKAALKRLWGAKYSRDHSSYPTIREVDAKKKEKAELEDLADFLLYRALPRLNKTEPKLVQDYLSLAGLDGLDDGVTLTIVGDKRYVGCIAVKGYNDTRSLDADELRDAEQDIMLLVTEIRHLIKSAIEELKITKYEEKIKDTLNKKGLDKYTNNSDYVYFLDPQTNNLIFTCRKEDPNNYSRKNLIACEVQAGQELHNAKDIPYETAPDFDKLKIIAVSTTSGSSGRCWGTSDTTITYDPKLPDKIKDALGIYGKNYDSWLGGGNGSSNTVQDGNKIPAIFTNLGLTAREVHHSEYDSSD